VSGRFSGNLPMGRLQRAVDLFLTSEWQEGHAGRLTDLATRLRDVANEIEAAVDARLAGLDNARTAQELGE